jgi:S-adenosylmethionine hydrolase
MTTSRPIITLLTDFGERDAYIGAMKGVILTIIPDVQLVDISHQITPQDIHQAASILASAYAYYPAHTVHLAVVDPEVGAVRQPIALETPRGIFVAPDKSHHQPRCSWRIALIGWHHPATLFTDVISSAR